MIPSLDSIHEKLQSGGRLDAADAEWLFRPEIDLHAIGRMADAARRHRHGNVAYYNINAHLNPTNVCIYRCRLCAYSCDAPDTRAQTMTVDEVLARAAEAAEAGCTELHIVGGVNPELDLAWYCDILGRIHRAHPRLHLKAFTAVEIAWFAATSGQSVAAVLGQLMAVGLGSLPGGGAEIFAPEVRQRICPKKADAETWLAVHRAAHGLGLRSNATMLYGHVETVAQRVDHLLRLRQLQDETGGFQAFIPLAFHPENTPLAGEPRAEGKGVEGNGDSPIFVERKSGQSPERKSGQSPSGLLDLRTVAISRLFLDNFDHIKAYWVSLGVGTAQVALCYGADDLDGTVRHERIHHDAGARSPEALSVEEIRRLIREAGCEPIERDSLYQEPQRHKDTKGSWR